MFNNQALANDIRTTREEKMLTQLYMSHKLNVSQNCYSKLELGRSRISIERLFEITALLEVDPLEAIAIGRP
jgi:transcriptional regulator with XRE-family HTH domain